VPDKHPSFESTKKLRPSIFWSLGLGTVLASGAVMSGSPGAPLEPFTNSATASGIAPGIRNAVVHDRSTIIRCKDEYWLFYTGRGVPSWHSADLVTWTRGPSVFTNAPSWVSEAVPANRNLDYWKRKGVKPEHYPFQLTKLTNYWQPCPHAAAITHPISRRDVPRYEPWQSRRRHLPG
jgi:hypothetical protein